MLLPWGYVSHYDSCGSWNMMPPCQISALFLLLLLLYALCSVVGFAHSAFTFSQESRIHHMSDNSSMVPPGALISIVLKGLLYTEAEISLNEVSRTKL